MRAAVQIKPEYCFAAAMTGIPVQFIRNKTLSAAGTAQADLLPSFLGSYNAPNILRRTL
jgi:hypothetical protein